MSTKIKFVKTLLNECHFFITKDNKFKKRVANQINVAFTFFSNLPLCLIDDKYYKKKEIRFSYFLVDDFVLALFLVDFFFELEEDLFFDLDLIFLEVLFFLFNSFSALLISLISKLLVFSN